MNIASILATKGNKVVTIRAGADRSGTRCGCWPITTSARWSSIDASRRPVGILSERDVVRAAVRDEAVFGLTVSQLMTRDVIVGAPRRRSRAPWARR